MRSITKKSVIVLALWSFFVYSAYETYGILEYTRIVRSGGLISNSFGVRIADMMVDILFPNFDSSSYASSWQRALDDLAKASSNREITHVQLRIFWEIDPDNRTSWEYPQLGSLDSTQQQVMNNWKKWLFGSPAPTYGPSAAERIHNAGFKVELCLAVPWTGSGTLSDAVDVFGWGGRESDYNFNGELFLQNYWQNCLKPVAEFLASSPNFGDGDIFMLAFEIGYPTADFTWLHNDAWKNIISNVRQIFVDAGKPNVQLTIDQNAWYNDSGLGDDACALLTDNLPDLPGLSGAKYLADLDFISISFWLPILRTSDIPATWTDADIDWVADAWRNNKNFFKVGTGHDGVSGVYGRDFIADFDALSRALNNKKVLMNTGYVNSHNTLAGGGGSFDNQAQRVAWAAQIRAVRNQTWCAGQDFERYTSNKATTTSIDTSWRNAPAQEIIMQEILSI